MHDLAVASWTIFPCRACSALACILCKRETLTTMTARRAILIRFIPAPNNIRHCHFALSSLRSVFQLFYLGIPPGLQVVVLYLHQLIWVALSKDTPRETKQRGIGTVFLIDVIWFRSLDSPCRSSTLGWAAWIARPTGQTTSICIGTKPTCPVTIVDSAM